MKLLCVDFLPFLNRFKNIEVSNYAKVGAIKIWGMQGFRSSQIPLRSYFLAVCCLKIVLI